MTDHPHDTAPSAGDPLDPCRWGTERPEEDAPPADPSNPARRERHDAFTDAKKSDFLTALVKTGCILDACRALGVSARTIYRHQESDPRFSDNCTAALRMSATPFELTAWQRAVEGVEQEFACGGQVHVRRRYSDSLLRLLLQGSNPKKYGARPGFKRKRLYRHEKKQMEREIRAQIRAERAANTPSPEAATELILERIGAIRRHSEEQQLAAGWTRGPEDYLIPPGYGPIPGWQPPAQWESGAETPRDSM
jgi:hypothetical protein